MIAAFPSGLGHVPAARRDARYVPPLFSRKSSARSIKLPTLMKKRLFFYVLWFFLLIALAAAAAVGGAWYWAHKPMQLKADRIDFVVDPGSSPRTVARVLNDAGVPVWEPGFIWMARLSELDKQMKAGGYQAINGDSPWKLLERLARGDMTQRQITFLEGWTYRQIRQALRANPDVKQTLGETTDEELMERLARKSSSRRGCSSRTPTSSRPAAPIMICCAAPTRKASASCRTPGPSANRTCR